MNCPPILEVLTVNKLLNPFILIGVDREDIFVPLFSMLAISFVTVKIPGGRKYFSYSTILRLSVKKNSKLRKYLFFGELGTHVTGNSQLVIAFLIVPNRCLRSL